MKIMKPNLLKYVLKIFLIKKDTPEEHSSVHQRTNQLPLVKIQINVKVKVKKAHVQKLKKIKNNR
jgi:hypothetical protein